ncbi:hypothetical protein V6O07_23945, partial [Arthrospira platensis SPKY2]
DRQDTLFDSAIFLEAGSFNVGTASILGTGVFENLNVDYTIQNGGAFCPGECRLVKAGSSPIAIAEYQWFLNGEAIPGATEWELEICEAGEYSVVITIGGLNGCSQTDTIIVETLPVPDIGDVDVLESCSEIFDLTEFDEPVLNGLFGFVTYHNTAQDAIDGFPFIEDPQNYIGFDGEVVYASLFVDGANCPVYTEFTLAIVDCSIPT